ncbi:MAG TPA: hypothetical protein VJ725_32375 [Thermoanaerobaculia bacterium]|nr:hypothetical protein [Thermoanaerobaculia bacterium]
MKARRRWFPVLGLLVVLGASGGATGRLQAQGTGPAAPVTSDVSSDATGDPEPQATTATPPEQTSGDAETKKTSLEPLVTNRATPYLVNGGLAVLALLTVVFTISFFREISQDRPAGIGIETSWGGFGGGLGGWKISPSLVYLLASLVFGSLLCMAVVGLTKKDSTEESAPAKGENKPAENQQAKDGK